MALNNPLSGIRTILSPGGALSADNIIKAAGRAANKAVSASGFVVGTDNNFTSRFSRNLNNGIPRGQANLKSTEAPRVTFLTAAQNGEIIAIEDDWRVRIGLGKSSDIFYKDTSNKLMSPLKETDGVIFPYTPEIVVTHMANYNSNSPTHSNYAQQFYSDSQVSDILITADFTCQNIFEGRYLMAAVQFFRSATKMFFGQGTNVGNPPPIVFLNGYGKLYFPNVPCVITNFSQRMGKDVDYIDVPVITESDISYSQYTNPKTGDPVQGILSPIRNETVSATENVRVPTATQLTVTVRPVYSRANLHNNFNLDEFAKGNLLGTRTTGGFI